MDIQYQKQSVEIDMMAISISVSLLRNVDHVTIIKVNIQNKPVTMTIPLMFLLDSHTLKLSTPLSVGQSSSEYILHREAEHQLGHSLKQMKFTVHLKIYHV